jgi:hypothetical protein
MLSILGELEKMEASFFVPVNAHPLKKVHGSAASQDPFKDDD